MPVPRRAVLLPAATVALCAAAPTAASADTSYTRCDDVDGVTLVQQARSSCVVAQPVAAAVGAAPAAEAPAAMAGAGFTPLRAEQTARGASSFDLVGLRGREVVRVRRAGAVPDLDGFAAGRELIFSRARIVGGAPIPRDAATCTSAFLVRLSGGRLGGLSAAHCAGLRSDGTAQRRNAAVRRPPQPGFVLGRVQRMVSKVARLDALVLPVPRGAGRTALPVVDRGVSRPPWVVAGTAQLTAGRRVCYTGRTSGVDRCGRLAGSSARAFERFLSARAGTAVRCTTITAAPGDSGGPVYTRARADGTVRALGITTLVFGRRQQMCFTPVAPVLDRIGGRVATG